MDNEKPKPFVFAIRAEYARRILDGSKRWEFRTRCPSFRRGDTALIYESRGRGRVVASFRRGVIVEGTPAAVWNEVIVLAGYHGISRDAYFEYFEDRVKAYAIQVTDVVELDLELPPGMSPPQSWVRWRGAWPLGDGS